MVKQRKHNPSFKKAKKTTLKQKFTERMLRWDYKAGKDYEFVGYIEDKIKKEHYSPDVVIVRMKTEDKKFKAEICTKTLYNYIDKGLFLNISSKDLLIKRQDSKGSIKSNKEST